MSTDRYLSVNKFMNAITDIAKDSKYVVVFFEEFFKTKYNWCIKPIGYNLIKETDSPFIDSAHKSYVIKLDDIHERLREMKYIQFQEDKRKKMSSLTHNKLYKLIIDVREKDYNSFKYHQSFVREADQKLFVKVKKAYEDFKNKLDTDVIEDDDDLAIIENIQDMI